jgi:hypothetical protein
MHAQSRTVEDRETVRLRATPLRGGAAFEQVLNQLPSRALISRDDARVQRQVRVEHPDSVDSR